MARQEKPPKRKKKEKVEKLPKTITELRKIITQVAGQTVQAPQPAVTPTTQPQEVPLEAPPVTTPSVEPAVPTMRAVISPQEERLEVAKPPSRFIAPEIDQFDLAVEEQLLPSLRQDAASPGNADAFLNQIIRPARQAGFKTLSAVLEDDVTLLKRMQLLGITPSDETLNLIGRLRASAKGIIPKEEAQQEVLQRQRQIRQTAVQQLEAEATQRELEKATPEQIAARRITGAKEPESELRGAAREVREELKQQDDLFSDITQPFEPQVEPPAEPERQQQVDVGANDVFAPMTSFINELKGRADLTDAEKLAQFKDKMAQLGMGFMSEEEATLERAKRVSEAIIDFAGGGGTDSFAEMEALILSRMAEVQQTGWAFDFMRIIALIAGGQTSQMAFQFIQAEKDEKTRLLQAQLNLVSSRREATEDERKFRANLFARMIGTDQRGQRAPSPVTFTQIFNARQRVQDAIAKSKARIVDPVGLAAAIRQGGPTDPAVLQEIGELRDRIMALNQLEVQAGMTSTLMSVEEAEQQALGSIGGTIQSVARRAGTQ